MIDNKTKHDRLTKCITTDLKYYKLLLGTLVKAMRYLEKARGPTWITTT